MDLPKELVVRLQDRLQKLHKTWGKKATNIQTINDLAVLVLTRYLDKKDNKENNPGCNDGMTWAQFKRANFNSIYMRDKGRCYLCNQRLSRDKVTLDHNLSKNRGGTNIITNVFVCCSWCNNDKGILTEEEYRYKQLVNKAKGIEPPIP